MEDDQIVMAALDVYRPQKRNEDVDSEIDWDHESNLLEQRSEEFFQNGNASMFPELEMAAGAARILLEQGFQLEIFPASSRNEEQWRLFQPMSSEGRTTTDGTHLGVAGGHTRTE